MGDGRSPLDALQQQESGSGLTRRAAHRLSGAALALGLGVAAWGGAAPQGPITSVQLGDGSRIVLDAVTFGTQQSVRGSLWQRLAYALLPAVMKARAGCAVRTGFRQGRLVFWVRRAPAASVKSRKVSLRVLPTNERGDEGPPQPGSTDDTEWGFDTFPRRGRMVGVRIYAERERERGWVLVGTLLAPNAAAEEFPAWTPRSLPGAVQSGPLTVSLRRAGARRPPTFDPAAPSIQPFELRKDPLEPLPAALSDWELELETARAGQPNGDWEVASAEVSDATGNHYRPPVVVPQEGARQGRWHVLLVGPHCVGEPVVKLRLELQPRTYAPAGPEEICTLRRRSLASLPETGEYREMSGTLERDGVHLELSGCRLYPDAELGRKQRRIALDYSWRPYPGGTARLVRVTDERGRRATIEAVAPGMTGRDGGAMAVLLVPEGAQSLDLSFALTRSRYVELLIAPPRAPEPDHSTARFRGVRDGTGGTGPRPAAAALPGSPAPAQAGGRLGTL
jgi:hypothetical protein